MKTLTLDISGDERLDTALAKTLNISRSQAQKFIKDGRVLLDKKLANAHMIVRPHTTISLKEETVVAPRSPKSLPTLDILYEDQDVLVVNKPAGLLVHNAPGQDDVTLQDALLKHAPEMKKAGADENRSGIVHRLDKEASGVLITAKTPGAFRHLKRQFAERRTEKRYTVLVMGNVKDDVGTIRFPIARSSTKARMAARPEGQDGKEAVTHFTVRARFSNSTLLDVHIETGRTHQIRAHFFALGYPVAGDTLYAQKDIKPLSDLHRLFLHARELTIALPDGEEKTFTAPLPQELTDVLTKLKPRR